jgi:hypothetical protein
MNHEADSADCSSEVQTAHSSVAIEGRARVGSPPYRIRPRGHLTVGPIILWLIGFFILMSFDGRGNFLGKWLSSPSRTFFFYPPIFSRRCSITSSFAPQNTGDGKRNSCASAAEQFLSPKTPSPSSLPHMCQRRGAPIEALTVEAVHEWALPRGCGSSGNGIESAVV